MKSRSKPVVEEEYIPYDYHNRSRCPTCETRLLVPAMGPSASLYLLVGEYPDYQAVEQGRPVVNDAENVLRDELSRVGLGLDYFRVTNLWLHGKAPGPSKDPKKPTPPNACDPDWHLNQMVKEFENRTHILLMGSEVTKALLGVNAGDYAGLQVKVPGCSAHVWVSPSPILLLFGAPVGELRLAFQRFAADVNKKRKQ